MMKRSLFLATSAYYLFSGAAFAADAPMCNAGPKEGWQPKEKLEQRLNDNGWKVMSVKEANDCYAVQATSKEGARVEAYFHPVTLESVPTKMMSPALPKQ